MARASALFFALTIGLLLPAVTVYVAGGKSPATIKINNEIHQLKPSIDFDDLELKRLCDNHELRRQFPRKLRLKWTKCLGLGRIYLSRSRSVGSSKSRFDDATRKRLRLYLTTTDDSLNVFCRLANSWKACAYHLRDVHCLAANHDAIQLAKNPKYSPLHQQRPAVGSGSRSNTGKHRLALHHREDDIENMAELYKVRCDHIRMTAQYMSGGGEPGGAESMMPWLNRFNQDLFLDYQTPEDDDEDEEEWLKRQEL